MSLTIHKTEGAKGALDRKPKHKDIMKTKEELETLAEMRTSGALMLTDMHGHDHCYPIVDGRAIGRFGFVDRSILQTNDTAIFIR